MLNLFGSPSYEGSELQRILKVNPAFSVEFCKENVDKFAAALMKEYPDAVDLYFRATKIENPLVGDKLSDKVKEAINAAIPVSIAMQASQLTMSASGIALYYGSQIDQLKTTNGGAAYAIACALAEYINACNISAAECDGGYRRHLSAYLVLRDAMHSYDCLGPWEQRMAAVEVEQRKVKPDYTAPKLDTETSNMLRTFVPKSEQAVLGQVARQLDVVKNTLWAVNMMPGVTDTIYLQLVLNTPQLVASGQWAGYPPALYRDGRCTFCGGPARCISCEQRLMQVVATSHMGNAGYGARHAAPVAERAAQVLINAGINPYR